MKSTTASVGALIAALAIGGLTACPDRDRDAVDDVLDNRPAERLQDKGEDIRDRVKDATN